MQFVAQVNNLYGWQRGPNAPRQLYQRVLLLFRTVECLNGRGRTAQYNRNLQDMPQRNSCLACMVGWALLALFIGWLVLLVQDDDAQFRHWREQTRPRPDYYIHLPHPHPPPPPTTPPFL